MDKKAWRVDGGAMAAPDTGEAARLIRRALAGQLSDIELAAAWPESADAPADVRNARQSVATYLTTRRHGHVRLAALMSEDLGQVAAAFESGHELNWAAEDVPTRDLFGVTAGFYVSAAAAIGWSGAAIATRDSTSFVAVVVGAVFGLLLMAMSQRFLGDSDALTGEPRISVPGLVLILGPPAVLAAISTVSLRGAPPLGLPWGLSMAAGTATAVACWVAVAHRTKASSGRRER